MTEHESDDRRVQRTRESLFRAFRELVLTRRYDEIKVGDIIGQAGVARSTFYEHYQSKDDMLRQSMSFLLGILADAATDAHDPTRLRFVVDHFWENRRFAGMLHRGRTRTIIVRALADALEPRLAALWSARPVPPAAPPALLAAQIAEAQMALLGAWLTGQASCDAEIIARTLAATSRAMADSAP